MAYWWQNQEIENICIASGPFIPISVYFMNLRATALIGTYNLYIFLMDQPLYYYVVSVFISLTTFIGSQLASEIRETMLAGWAFVFIYHPLSFILYVFASDMCYFGENDS